MAHFLPSSKKQKTKSIKVLTGQEPNYGMVSGASKVVRKRSAMYSDAVNKTRAVNAKKNEMGTSCEHPFRTALVMPLFYTLRCFLFLPGRKSKFVIEAEVTFADHLKLNHAVPVFRNLGNEL